MTDRYARLKVQRQRERQSVKAADLVRLAAFLQPKEFTMSPEHAETLRAAVTETARKALEESAKRWDEAEREKLFHPQSPPPDTRPRDPVYNKPITFTPQISVDGRAQGRRSEAITPGGRIIPNPN